MDELALCLEYILMNHDRVGIDGLGTFEAKAKEAVYESDEETMLPPRRMVVFHSGETQQADDIIPFIERIYDIPSEEAQKKLGDWVDELRGSLEVDGSVRLPGVGTFTEEEGTLSLEPTQAGITCPDFYALDTLPLPQIEERKGDSTPVLRSDDRRVTISLSKGALAYAAVACVAVVLFFAFGTTVVNTGTHSEQSDASSLLMPNWLNLFHPSQDEAEPVNVDKTEAKAVTHPNQPEPSPKQTQASPSETQTPTPTQAEETTEESRFCIVVASAVPQKNAEDYVKTLKERGISSARVMEGTVRRVAVGRYDTEEEARQAVRRMHDASEEFAYAWVYETR